MQQQPMQVDIWSDVVCPWCFIGKRRFEAALARFDHADSVAVRWRSFELDPNAPAQREGDYVAALADKYGTERAQAQAMIDRMTATAAGEGLDFRFDRVRPGRTFDAHRLLHLAAEHGLQDALKERMLTAYMTEGAAIGSAAVLADLATQVGLGRQMAEELLSGDQHADAVRADERTAMELGISGVPFFVVDRRFGISGAQPAEVILGALQRAWSERAPLAMVGAPSAGADADGDACADGSCAV